MDYDTSMRMMLVFWVLLIITIVITLIGSFIDYGYKMPIAAENANNYCKTNGFDHHESYQRIGFFSTDPIAIKCKYAEQNLNVNDRR